MSTKIGVCILLGCVCVFMGLGPGEQNQEGKPVGVNFEWTQDARTTETTLIVYDLGLPEDGTKVGIPNSALVYWREDVSSPHFIDRTELALIPGHRYQWHVAAIMPLGYSLSKPATFIAGPKFAQPDQSGVTWEKWRLIDRDGGRTGESVGSSVALTEGFAAVASIGKDGTFGRIIVHQQIGDRWADVAQLGSYMGDGHREDGFGCSLAIDDDLIAGGAPAAKVDTREDVGVVHLFRDYHDPGASGTASMWAHEYTLTPHTRQAGSRFGHSVDVEENNVLIGAPGEQNKDGSAGAVYLFTFKGTHWEESYRWTPEAEGEIQFGSVVAMDDETIAISSRNRDDRAVLIHVLARSGSGWSRSRVMVPTDKQSRIDLDVSGSTLVVGVAGDQDGARAYVFERSDDAWDLVTRLTAGPSSGASVSIFDDAILIGRHSGGEGAANLFRRGDDGWSLRSTLRSSVNQEGDLNGADVAIRMNEDGTYLAITGAPGVDHRYTNQGAAYLYPISD